MWSEIRPKIRRGLVSIRRVCLGIHPKETNMLVSPYVRDTLKGVHLHTEVPIHDTSDIPNT